MTEVTNDWNVFQNIVEQEPVFPESDQINIEFKSVIQLYLIMSTSSFVYVLRSIKIWSFEKDLYLEEQRLLHIKEFQSQEQICEK